ncbi:MAG: glycosyltransferase family 9 protein [Bacteroidia bacterium]|nr:glycosyltransferase family 9 protein [Bacteroidia bacterium]MDW8088379.1 glycosyltransferase family 9 protein [Bacteroidia bacterium]
MRFLLVRLSSMGDVVLTTPLIRALAERFPTAEIHFLTRAPYKPLVAHHPLLYAVHIWPLSREVRQTFWEGVLDLQKNLRTLPLRWRLRYRHFTTFPKENWRKWLMVRRKQRLPIAHVVLRYGQALAPWGIPAETLGPLEVYIPTELIAKVRAEMQALHQGPWLAVGLGGTYATKKWPTAYYIELLRRVGLPVVLLGGVPEAPAAETIAKALPQPALIGAGRYTLLETAAAIYLAEAVLSHDTGTAHLSAAFRKPTLVLWGNTTPAFGMTPWQTPYLGLEIPGLNCRPCSKLGFSHCPKGHHDCLRGLTPSYVESRLIQFFNNLAVSFS